jgi:hypothetical protein
MLVQYSIFSHASLTRTTTSSLCYRRLVEEWLLSRNKTDPAPVGGKATELGRNRYRDRSLQFPSASRISPSMTLTRSSSHLPCGSSQLGGYGPHLFLVPLDKRAPYAAHSASRAHIHVHATYSDEIHAAEQSFPNWGFCRDTVPLFCMQQ